ncbi:MAG: transporter permease, partial [Marmoricola sp.]|nr:transporter permease [Marmoricola sp.]
ENVLRTLGARRRQLFTRMLLPNCLQWIFSALRVAIAFAIIGAIVGEFISAKAGIGYMIDVASGSFDTTGMLVPLLTLMVLAFALDRLILVVSNKLLRWRVVDIG